MKDWVLSCEGDQWCVKFDVRDLGGHLDTTFRGCSSTLAAWVRLVISQLVLIFVLPLDFHGRVRLVRSMYLPAALHGVEASLLASESLRKLRSAIRRVVWSRRQPLASVGAVLSLLDGPTGCDPVFCVVWFRFRLLRRYLALWPAEVGGVYRLLEMVGEGCPGHGPFHLLSASSAEVGFHWDPDVLAWFRPGLPMLSNLAGPIQHFKIAILDAWRNKVAAALCDREGFRGGSLLDIHGSLQLQKEGDQEYHTANQLQKKCKKRQFLSIHDRFIRDAWFRKTMIELGRTEEVIREMDKLANEDHTHIATEETLNVYRSNWWIRSNFVGSDTMPIRYRPDFKEALSTLRRLKNAEDQGYYQNWWQSSSSSWWQWQDSWWHPSSETSPRRWT